MSAFKFKLKQIVKLTSEAINDVYAKTGIVLDGQATVLAIAHSTFNGPTYTIRFDALDGAHVMIMVERGIEAVEVNEHQKTSETDTAYDAESVDYHSGALNVAREMQMFLNVMTRTHFEIAREVERIFALASANKINAEKRAAIVAARKAEDEKEVVDDIVKFAKVIDPDLGDFLEDIIAKFGPK